MENNPELVGSKTDSSKDSNRSVDENPIALSNAGVIAGTVQDDAEQGRREEGEEHDGKLEPEQSRPNRTSSSRRTPFADLSQVDADWALARTLQEQERAYMMLSMNNEGSDHESWETGSYLPDEDDDLGDHNDESDLNAVDEVPYYGTDVDDGEDAFDVHAHEVAGENNDPAIEFDPDAFSSDEAYARALQDAEERELAARILALTRIDDREDGDSDVHSGHLPDTWEEADPDELSYEELLALGEVVGSESRGLSAATIASLPSVSYKAGSTHHGDSCVICRLDYEDGETLTVLSCKHTYHPECINNWLKINRVCPVCSTEVVAAGNNS